MVKSNNYGFLISLVLHLIILAIPVSMTVSRHFKEIELFVINERPIPNVQEKAIKPKPKEMPKEIIKELPPQLVIKESEIEEPLVLMEVPVSNVVEPAIISNRQDAVPLPPAPKPAPPVVVATPKPLLDVEFGSDNAPGFIHREMPVYPLMARRLGKEGRVLLRLVIDEKGRLLNVEVVEGAGFGFTKAAIEAVKKSTFQPAMQDGRPVMSKTLLSIKFILRRD